MGGGLGIDNLRRGSLLRVNDRLGVFQCHTMLT